jgi:hypothetical protein
MYLFLVFPKNEAYIFFHFLKQESNTFYGIALNLIDQIFINIVHVGVFIEPYSFSQK